MDNDCFDGIPDDVRERVESALPGAVQALGELFPVAMEASLKAFIARLVHEGWSRSRMDHFKREALAVVEGVVKRDEVLTAAIGCFVSAFGGDDPTMAAPAFIIPFVAAALVAADEFVAANPCPLGDVVRSAGRG